MAKLQTDVHGAARWYEDHADEYRDARAVELAFVGLPDVQQDRLNRFKLWHLREGGLMAWDDLDVLDFGAGHGRFALEFQGYRSYLGVDLSAGLVSIGRARFREAGLENARLEQGDCLDFDDSAAGYDLVCTFGMLPYVKNLDVAILRMARHVKAGGCFAGDFRRSSPLYDLIRNAKWRLSRPTGGSSRVDSETQIRAALHAAGLTDVRIVMREYPLLASWYARHGWEWPLRIRNWLARYRCFNFLATDAWFVASRPAAT